MDYLLITFSVIPLFSYLIITFMRSVRLRRSRKCTKCKYSLDGLTALQCPECGTHARALSLQVKLYIVLLCVIWPAFVLWGAHALPRIPRRGASGLWPTILWPVLLQIGNDEQTDSITQEIRYRASSSMLTSSEWTTVIWSCLYDCERHSSRETEAVHEILTSAADNNQLSVCKWQKLYATHLDIILHIPPKWLVSEKYQVGVNTHMLQGNRERQLVAYDESGTPFWGRTLPARMSGTALLRAGPCPESIHLGWLDGSQKQFRLILSEGADILLDQLISASPMTVNDDIEVVAQSTCVTLEDGMREDLVIECNKRTHQFRVRAPPHLRTSICCRRTSMNIEIEFIRDKIVLARGHAMFRVDESYEFRELPINGLVPGDFRPADRSGDVIVIRGGGAAALHDICALDTWRGESTLTPRRFIMRPW